MKKIFTKLKGLIPSKRKLIQLYSALLFNANIKGFFNGKIYMGPVKNICTPGLNCYSCPGASGACPLGSLQNAVKDSGHRTPYYVIGIIILYGILFGRLICGFLCPFGLIQELLYKIKTPKLKKNHYTRILSYLKYVILVLFVVVIPILYGIRNVTIPGFCKYICPAGTIEGAFGLLSNAVNAGEFARLGPLFTWKFLLTVSVIVGSVFIFRMFCRFICPLGALYGLFNRFSILGIKLDKPKCVDCGLCITKCKMDIRHVGDHECINCGECISVCPTKAISWKGGKVILPPDEIAPVSPKMSDEEREECIRNTEIRNKKNAKRRLITRIVSAVVMISVLSSALVYYNFIDKPPVTQQTYKQHDTISKDYNISLYNGTDAYDAGVFNMAKPEGKVIVLNFWYVDCPGCVAELPDFAKVSASLADKASIIAVTKASPVDIEKSHEFIKTFEEENPESKIVWATDKPISDPNSANELYTMFGGSGTYPMTVIIDMNGKIFSIIQNTVNEVMLENMISGAYAASSNKQ